MIYFVEYQKRKALDGLTMIGSGDVNRADARP